MEFRQISADERPEVMYPLQAYAFEASPSPEEALERYRSRMRYFTSGVGLVAEEGGAALACASALPMRQNVRGEVRDMAGVASVASHPSARRRGLVRELLTRLLRQMRDQGCPVSALYPFRPGFYARFGYVGIPRVRKARFTPEGLAELLRRDLPGSVTRSPMREAFPAYEALTHRLLRERHGFAVFDEVRGAEFREDPFWLAVARSGDEVVGAVRYRITEFGGELLASNLFATGPLGRALLLRYLARHVDQVSHVEVFLGADEIPDLWATEMEVTTTGRLASPGSNAPMVRVLDLPALAGTPVGAGGLTVEVADDELIGGVWRLGADDGRLTVQRGGGTPAATLTAAGLSALVYGVLDPVEVVLRGLGTLGAPAVEALGTLFPRRIPYMFAEF
ncbi:GNAT family N-acetyltransferase [Actinoplanes sp. NPDC051851]|uniref:GNAT family N-acetyltransferase n=1 Tax=Actinoplanes sp. NPDC051851 TaxID=3154753 RepID=UPI00342F429D